MAAGVTAAHRGDLTEAKHQFQRAVALAPQIAEPHAALGSVLLALNEVDPAITELQTAHRLAPRDADIDLTLANAYLSAGSFSRAVIGFREFLNIKSQGKVRVEDCIAFATALSAAGQNTDAESTLREALTHDASSPQLNDALGILLARRGAFQQAAPLFQRAVALQSTFSPAQAHLGSTLIALGQPAEAIAPLQAAVASDPSSLPAQLDLGRALSAVHKDVEAIDSLHRARNLLRPDTPSQAIYSLALAFQASGDAASAVALFQTIEDPNSSSSEFLINYALARVQTGDAKDALPLYARALTIGPDTAGLREDYGVAYLQQAELDHAIEQFEHGLKLNRNDASLHYDLGLAFKLKDNLATAIPEFQRAAEIDPHLPDPPYTLGILYMQQGRFDEAAAQFRTTINLQPTDGNAWASLGSVLKDSGDSSGALDALNHAVVLKPDQPNLHIQLAAVKLQMGDKDGAVTERKIAADLSRTAIGRQRATFALNSGRSLFEQGKLQDAIDQFIIAAQADPSLADPHKVLAQAYEKQGKSAEAAVERQTAASLEAAGKPQR